jgi:hypothetical protein
MPLTQAENTALSILAADLGVDRDSLYNLIYFESRWKPDARNPISGARGLIQFTNTTARGMGYASADDLVSRFPTRLTQLTGPVRAYFQARKPYTGSIQDLYMTVFYPAARKWPGYYQFPADVRKQNPGITTPADYIRKVYAAAGMRYIAPLALLAIAGGILYFLLK